MFTVAHINARSLIGNFVVLKDYLLLHNFSIVAITETWLSPAIDSQLLEIPGYHIIRKDRSDGRRGGGVAIYIQQCYSCTFLTLTENCHCEQLWIRLKVNSLSLAFGVIYRPPYTNVTEFISNLENNLHEVFVGYDWVLCAGDFNINILDGISNYSQLFEETLSSLGLYQIINEPTRIGKHSVSLLDLMVTNSLPSTSGVADLSGVSDHLLIHASWACNNHSVVNPTYHTFREFGGFDYDTFCSDLRNLPWGYLFSLVDIDLMVAFFSDCLLSLFDVHAPIKTRRFCRPRAPWLTNNIKLMMSLRDDALKKAKRNRSQASLNYYKQLRNYTSSAIKREKKAYLTYSVQHKCSKDVWSDLRDMNIHVKKNVSIPAELCSPDDINKFFASNATPVPVSDDLLAFYSDHNFCEFHNPFNFAQVSETEIGSIISSIKSNACGSDNISIKMLSLCCPLLLPHLTHIINFCLMHSVFPRCWGEAVVVPVPKNSNPKEYSDLRPISILPVLSKILEKVVDAQIRLHLNQFQILPSLQSGFRAGYSCASALTCITDDIFRATDNNKITILVCLDYSKAFDVINHDLLFAILHYIGFSRHAILFFKAYFSDRRQLTKLNDQYSGSTTIRMGVGQGSILGPLIYSVYTAFLLEPLRVCNYHMYADDIQIYHSFDPSRVDEEIARINSDMNQVVMSSSAHGLTINPSKTTVMVFGRPKARSLILDRVKLQLQGKTLAVTESIKNLGLNIDCRLRFTKHVTNMVRASFGKLKVLYGCRDCLDVGLRRQLCETLILSRFNYCDTVYGPCLDSKDTFRIQKVQNACLRFIYGIRRRQRISWTLVRARWLNMRQRRVLHACVFYHKLILTKIPPYLHRRITFRTDVHNINVRNRGLLTPPIYKSAFFTRSFTYSIAALYNPVPSHYKTLTINGFSASLRRFLFSGSTLG